MNCAWCGHPKSDHRKETAREYDGHKAKPGDEHPKKYPITNPNAYCHVALCTCEGFVS